MKKRMIVLGLGTVAFCLMLHGTGPEVGRDIDEVNVGRGNRRVIDKIVARVNGHNVLLSHLKEPRIDREGKRYSLEEAVDAELMFQQAADPKKKLLPTPIELEKQISIFKEMHHISHLSEKEFEDRLRADGITIEKYRKQLGRVLAIRNVRQMEVSERVVITAREVEMHYKAHPERSEDRYLLKTKIVPFSVASTPEEAKREAERVSWIDVDWIDRSRLAEGMAFVKGMKPGEVSKPIKVAQGFQFVKLIQIEESRMKTLTERWGDIEKFLQGEKMDKFEKEYVGELRAKSSIIYLN